MIMIEGRAEIVEAKNAESLRGLGLVMVSGGFDPIHVGHVYLLRAAERIGPVVAVVNGDWFLRNKKGREFMPLEQRAEIVSEMRSVSYVIPYETAMESTVLEMIKAVRPMVFANGGDRSEKKEVPEARLCEELGIEMAFGVGGDEKAESSSGLLGRWGLRVG
jgi:D-beta-D-heptose 7-phosphate kinase/D-beta-D-heptose 1-phosphate adenosyltransferase